MARPRAGPEGRGDGCDAAVRAGMTRDYYYQVDREGRVFHDGTEIVDPATLRFFMLAMKAEPDGRHLAVCQGERNWFAAHDTPFVVQRLHLVVSAGELDSVDLELAGGYRERLDPARLEAADAQQVWCRVRQGAFRARFGRVAMQQIAPFVRDEGGPTLVLAGASYPIREASPLVPGRP